MPSRRKQITMLVTVSVPVFIASAKARAMVRDTLTSETVWDYTLKRISPAASVLADAAMARQAWGKVNHPKPRKGASVPPLLEAMGAK